MHNARSPVHVELTLCSFSLLSIACFSIIHFVWILRVRVQRTQPSAMPQNVMQCIAMWCASIAELIVVTASRKYTIFTRCENASERMASLRKENECTYSHIRDDHRLTIEWALRACEWLSLCACVCVRQKRERRNWQTERDSPLTRISIMMKSQRARLTLKSALRLYYIYTFEHVYLFCAQHAVRVRTRDMA